MRLYAGMCAIVMAFNQVTAVVLLWTSNITAPWTPLSMGVSASRGTVALGARDCPDNTKSTMFFLGLNNGTQDTLEDRLEDVLTDHGNIV